MLQGSTCKCLAELCNNGKLRVYAAAPLAVKSSVKVNEEREKKKKKVFAFARLPVPCEDRPRHPRKSETPTLQIKIIGFEKQRRLGYEQTFCKVTCDRVRNSMQKRGKKNKKKCQLLNKRPDRRENYGR